MIGENVETFNIGINTVDVIDFLETEEVFVEGGEMIRRAKTLRAAPGLRQAKLMLNHSEAIPESCDYFDLVFAGARIKSTFVPYLRKVRKHWHLGYGNVNFDWDEKARLVRFSLLF